MLHFVWQVAEADGIHTRFATVSDEHIGELLDKRLSQNTKRVIDHSVAAFSAYLHERNTSLADLYRLPQTEVNKHLQCFYPVVRKKDGSLYGQNGLVSLRYGLQKHFSKKCGYDVINDAAFRSSSEVFAAVLVEMKKLGIHSVQHKPQLSQSDFNKLYHSSVLSTSDPVGLQNKVFVDVMMYLSSCGREDLRSMKKSDFHIRTDSTGDRYVTSSDSYSKGRHKDARMYHLPGNPRCPVASFEKYLAKLNSESDVFWQRPITTRVVMEDWCWYDRAAVGKNTLASKMKTLSVEAKLSTIYTNHCLRWTHVVSIWNPQTSLIK